jgi:hypothetical protein
MAPPTRSFERAPAQGPAFVAVGCFRYYLQQITSRPALSPAEILYPPRLAVAAEQQKTLAVPSLYCAVVEMIQIKKIRQCIEISNDHKYYHGTRPQRASY